MAVAIFHYTNLLKNEELYVKIKENTKKKLMVNDFLNSEGKQNRTFHYVMCVFLNKKNISTVKMYGDEINR